MSPEFIVGEDSRGRGEIIIKPVLGDGERDFSRALIIGNLATGLIKRRKLEGAVSKLSELLPKDVSQLFVNAVRNGLVGTRIVFIRGSKGNFEVIENNISNKFNKPK